MNIKTAKRLLTYNPENGKLYWKGTDELAEKIDFFRMQSYVLYEKKKYKTHRLVIMLTTGSQIPEGKIVDHIDGNSLNNRIENLRIVTQKENMKNKLVYRITNKNSKVISSCILLDTYKGKTCFTYYRGKEFKRFKTLEEAIKYRNTMNRLLGFTNRHNTHKNSFKANDDLINDVFALIESRTDILNELTNKEYIKLNELWHLINQELKAGKKTLTPTLKCLLKLQKLIVEITIKKGFYHV